MGEVDVRGALEKIVGELETMKHMGEQIKGEAAKYKEGMQCIREAGKGLKKMEAYKLVKLAAKSHMNLEKTRRTYEKIKYFNAKADELEAWMKASQDQRTTQALLQIYEGILGVEEVRLEMEETMGEGLAAEIKKRDEKLRSLFDLLFFTLVDDLPGMIGRDDVLGAIKMLKVVQKEEARDKTAEAVAKSGESTERDRREYHEMYKRYEKRPPSKYRERMYEALIGSIGGKFKRAIEGDSRFANDTEQSGEYLSSAHLNFVLEDLKAIAKTRDIGIPRDLELFDFMCIHYHRNLYESLEEKAPQMDPNEALSLMAWTNSYYERMGEEFGKSAGSLGPRLFHGREKEMIQKYISTAKEKLQKWIRNLTEIEAERFVQRTRAPDLDPENRFISVGFMDLLHIIKQQIEPVTFHEELFADIVGGIMENVEVFKKSMFKVMDKELSLVNKDKGSSGFEEYCIAMGNSGLKFMDCLSELPFYGNPRIQELGGAFFEFLDKSTECLVLVVLETVKPVTKNLFREKWYKEPIVETAVATFKDYAEDYRVSMVEYAFETFVQSLFESFVLKYLERVVGKKSVFKAEAISRIVSDKRALAKFFGKFLSPGQTDSAFRPVDFVVSIINCDNPNLTVLEVNSLLSAYPETTPEFVKKLLSRKAGASSDEVGRIIKKCTWPPHAAGGGGATGPFSKLA